MYPSYDSSQSLDFRVHRTCGGDRFYSGAIFTHAGDLFWCSNMRKYIEVYVEEHSNTYDVYMEFENEDKMSMVIKCSGRGYPDLQRSIIKKRSKTQSVVIQATMELPNGKHAILYFVR